MMVGVIQVRMGSTRLPGKALKKILGKPLLWHLCRRVRAASLLDRVVIATAAGAENQPIVDFARDFGIDCFAGSEQDLVDRFYRTAQKFGATALVRVTGDCPLADPGVIDAMVRHFQANSSKYDYISNAIKPTFPDGLDLDIFSSATIERMHREVKDPFWREWFTSFLREHPADYRIANFENDTDLSALRWTVDYREDFDFTEAVFSRLYPRKKIFVMEDILELLKTEPSLGDMNRKYLRDAAYDAAKKACLPAGREAGK